jgi:hypothetical protein
VADRLPKWVVGAAVLAVLYAGLCKALLFHNLEYFGSDLYSFLEMSRSWHYGGHLLQDNVFGDHRAIHNFYLLLAFSPLTIPLGAYGLFLGLVSLDLLAVLRVATSGSLSRPGRLAVLAGFVSPVAYFLFDHRRWGFHPELCYPPLALLLALDLADGKWRRAIVVGALLALVKEDGAVLCASLLLAYFTGRFVDLRKAPAAERRKVVVTAFLSLLAVTLLFALGMAVLLAASRAVASPQATFAPRLLGSLKTLDQTLGGLGDPLARGRLERGLLGYALMAGLLLVPLGQRLFRGLLLLLVSAPPLVVVLVIEAGGYGSGTMLWPPRLATLLALVVACVVFASRTPSVSAASSPAEPRPAWGAAPTTALALVSWGLQLPLLALVGYSPWPRLDAWALLGEQGYRLSRLPKREVRLVRCLAERLPNGLPVAPAGDSHPIFHRQSIMFGGPDAPGGRLPRLRVVRSDEAPAAREGTTCQGPRVDGLAVEVECGLLPLINDCGRVAEQGPG